ncbi:MAG: molybdopterin-binding protein [Chloroflexota bacterium]|nr:molybdopterin-binding protein [Chloroflexota bacterium]
MKAEVICIGTELLHGEIADANSPYLAEQLCLLGIDLLLITLVGDDLEALQEALQSSLRSCDLVIAVGGLGPTEDDLTREAIAGVMGENMYVDPDLEKWLRGVFNRLGHEMPVENIKQAMLIPSAHPIPNPRGTAPGWWVKKGEKNVLALPGPPRELQRMWEKELLPEFRSRFSEQVIFTRTIKTWGLSESRLDELVSPLFPSLNPSLGVYARPDGVWIRIIAQAVAKETAKEMIHSVEEKILDLLKDHIWGFDTDSLDGIVRVLLDERKLSLAALELGSGGLLSSLLSASPQFKGGLVLNPQQVRTISIINLSSFASYDFPNIEAALDLGKAAIRHFDVDLGLGVVGTAVDTGQERAGTVCIATVGKSRERTVRSIYPPYQLKERAAFAALFELYRFLHELC